MRIVKGTNSPDTNESGVTVCTWYNSDQCMASSSSSGHRPVSWKRVHMAAHEVKLITIMWQFQLLIYTVIPFTVLRRVEYIQMGYSQIGIVPTPSWSPSGPLSSVLDPEPDVRSVVTLMGKEKEAQPKTKQFSCFHCES